MTVTDSEFGEKAIRDPVSEDETKPGSSQDETPADSPGDSVDAAPSRTEEDKSGESGLESTTEKRKEPSIADLTNFLEKVLKSSSTKITLQILDGNRDSDSDEEDDAGDDTKKKSDDDSTTSTLLHIPRGFRISLTVEKNMKQVPVTLVDAQPATTS